MFEFLTNYEIVELRWDAEALRQVFDMAWRRQLVVIRGPPGLTSSVAYWTGPPGLSTIMSYCWYGPPGLTNSVGYWEAVGPGASPFQHRNPRIRFRTL